LKSTDEFALFVGRRVKVLMDNSEQWVAGTILGTDKTGLTIRAGENGIRFDFSAIRKARLEDTEKDGN
jgi:ribosome maturation factor RimP